MNRRHQSLSGAAAGVPITDADLADLSRVPALLQFQRDPAAALSILDRLKASGQPIPKVDWYRAQAFLMQEDVLGARQALLEEARFFPNEPDADALWDLLSRVDHAVAGFFQLPDNVLREEPEFAAAYDVLKQHTMLHWKRMLHLFTMVRRVCREAQDAPGDLMECGVAGGGGSVLMGVAARLEGLPPRTVYAFDTFSGMPQPTESDVMLQGNGVSAKDSNWGTGTCASPTDHVLRLAKAFSVNVVPIVGDFSNAATVAASLPPALQRNKILAAHVDCDWQASTEGALENLVVPLKHRRGTAIQLDDYGYWGGCRTAADAFLSRHRLTTTWADVDGNAAWMHLH